MPCNCNYRTGCILGELISRAPMFRGADFLDQPRGFVDWKGGGARWEGARGGFADQDVRL